VGRTVVPMLVIMPPSFRVEFGPQLGHLSSGVCVCAWQSMGVVSGESEELGELLGWWGVDVGLRMKSVALLSILTLMGAWHSTPMWSREGTSAWCRTSQAGAESGVEAPFGLPHVGI